MTDKIAYAHVLDMKDTAQNSAPVPRDTPYPETVLNALPAGAIHDHRFKLALELLKARSVVELLAMNATRHESTTHVCPVSTRVLAANVCDLARDMYREAEARGWIEPLPTNNTLGAQELAHIQRSAAAGVEQQLHGARIMRGEQAGLAIASGGMLNG